MSISNCWSDRRHLLGPLTVWWPVQEEMISFSPYHQKKPITALLILTSACLVLHVLLHAFFPSDINIMGQQNSKLGGRMSEVSFLTWNIWFGHYKMPERMAALGQVVDQVRPDVIALQEVTRESIALIERQSWYQRYNLVPSDISSEGNYFVVILSVFPVQSWKSHTFQNSRMGRKLITAKIEVENKLVINVGTSHLESLSPNTQQREIQLRESLGILSQADNSCLMGDMNLEDNVDGDIILPYPWFDSWLSLHGEKRGYTWNPTINTMIKDLDPNANRRFDRVLCKLPDFKVKRMVIVGDHPTTSGIFPSDHFGLFTVLGRVRKYSRKLAPSAHQQQLQFRRPLS